MASDCNSFALSYARAGVGRCERETFMSEIDDIKRRRFLKMTAGAAGGLTAMSMLPPAIRQALATPTLSTS
jgi:hypothetical protein